MEGSQKIYYKKIKVVFMVVVVFLCIAGCSKEEMMDPVQIDEVDLTLVNDGTFEGEYTDPKSDGFAKVQITVSRHRIEALQIIDRQCSPVGKKGEYVVNNILKAQSVKVDAISGATTTSTIIMKATEVALNKGIDHE